MTCIEIPIRRRSTQERVERLWDQAQQMMAERNAAGAVAMLQLILNEPQNEEETSHA